MTYPTESHEAAQDVRAPDGRLLLEVRQGVPPLEYGDTGAYLSLPSTEVVLYSLNAASTGIIGNLAYDALKQLIGQARERNHTFLQTLKNMSNRGDGGVGSKEERRMSTDRVATPDNQLRDMLITIANDALVRHQHISQGVGRKPWSDVQVALSEDHTWLVYIREAGSIRGLTVEIDLGREEVSSSGPAVEGAGFPMRIWF